MAKKKNEQARSYMQMYIPQGGKKKYTSEMASFYGLDLKGTADSGTLLSCSNIDVKTLPNIESCSEPIVLDVDFYKGNDEIVGFYGYDGSCFILRTDGENIKLTRLDEDGGVLKNGAEISWSDTCATDSDGNFIKREMAVFCFYDIPMGKMAYEAEPCYYLLIYPDRRYIKVDFKSTDKSMLIAPVTDYDKSVSASHVLDFCDVLEDCILKVALVLTDDGKVRLKASGSVNDSFEGCRVKATFTDPNNSNYICTGKVDVKGKVSAADTGIFLQKVTGNTAVLRLVGTAPAGDVDSYFYVVDYNSSDIVYSEQASFEAGGVSKFGISKTFTVPKLSPNKKYYAFFDYNLEGENTLRYELYFTLSDEVISDSLSINGMLLDESGNDLVLDISRKYFVTYCVTDGAEKTFTPVPDDFTIQLGSSESATESLSPQFQHITVWNSRLFGTRDNVVVCSGAGTPFDWTLDSPESELSNFGITIGGYDETHAWYSTTQASTQASGDVTAIVSYDGHPIIFKDDYMHQVYNTKNPFRIQDICAVGCVSARGICELDSVLYFASADGIYHFAGGYPKRVSDALGNFACDAYTAIGAFDGVLYVYNPDFDDGFIFSYNPKSGLWAAVRNPFKDDIYAFTFNGNKLYLLGVNGEIAYFRENGNIGYCDWGFTTNIALFDSAADKRAHSLKIVAEGYMPEVQIGQNGVFKTVTDGGKIETTGGIERTNVLLRGFDGEYVRLRLRGDGHTKIHKLEIIYSYSGNRYR